MKRKLWLSLAYPALTVGSALALLVLVCVFLVGQFELDLQRLQHPAADCHAACCLSFRTSLHACWSRSAFIAGIVACVWLAGRLLLPRAAAAQLGGRLPLLGAVWRSMSLAEFCHLLALLVEGRLPLAEALD